MIGKILNNYKDFFGLLWALWESQNSVFQRKGGAMTPTMLRHLWSLIENTQTSFILAMDDTSLVQWLSHQLEGQRSLQQLETHIINDYIRSKLSLIRDLAHQRY
jgi:hypothetical protein